jgi:CheY-like chemotaxis protein
VRILFVDDDPENVELTASTLKDALQLSVAVVTTVEAAVRELHSDQQVDLLVTDIFIPLGEQPQGVLGPRALKKAEAIEHLGGLILLDELDRLPRCKVLVHTACVDRALLELLGERSVERVRKPAPPEVLIRAILDVIEEK